MPIDIDHEQLLPLTDAAKQIPGRPHFSAIDRWVRRGAHGRKLEVVWVGGRRFTSREAIRRFLTFDAQATNNAKPSWDTKSTGPQRRRQAEAALEQLKRRGIK